MRKVLLLFLCAIVLLGSVSAASDQIRTLQATVSVDADGICRVSVTAEVEFTSAPRQFLFPLGTDAYNIAASGASYEEETIDGVEFVVFESDIGFNGTQTFLCSYTLPCNMTESGSAQHFTLQLPESGFSLPIAKFALQVNFPAEVSALPVWESAYYSEVIDNYLHIQVSENTVTAESDMEFKDHETLTMSLHFPAETFNLRHLPGQTVSVLTLLLWLLLALSAGYWFFRLRNHLRIVKPLQAVHFEAGAGELPCQLYGAMPDMPAMLAHWGELGYLVIIRTRRGRIRLEKQMDMGNERSAAERRLFDAIFRSSPTCDTQSLRFLQASREEAGVLRMSWLRRLFKASSGSPKLLRTFCLLAGLSVSVITFDLWLPARAYRWFWLPILSLFSVVLCYLVQQAIARLYSYDRIPHLCLGAASAALLLLFGYCAGCFGTMLLNLLLQLLCASALHYGGQRTQAGEELLLEILGLRSFLRRANKDVAQRLLRGDGQYFYRMLPYAEGLGIGKLFAKRFSDGCKSHCRWLRDEGHSLRSATEFYALYREVAMQIRLQCRFTRTAAPAPRRTPPTRARRNTDTRRRTPARPRR